MISEPCSCGPRFLDQALTMPCQRDIRALVSHQLFQFAKDCDGGLDN